MDKKVLFRETEVLKGVYTGFWRDICNIESPTDYKAGVDAVGDYCIARAERLGWKWEKHHEEKSGDAVCLVMNPDAAGAPIALSAHMDTVHAVGSFGSPAVKIEGDIMYGPGVADCKGGIAVCFLAMEALQKAGFTERPVKLLLQADEENSCAFSEKRNIQWICDKAKDCIAFFNAERFVPGKTVLRRKGIMQYSLEVKGTGTHAMYCYEGKSAVREMAWKIIELEKLQDPEGITVNCGTISGGTYTNNVPDSCIMTVDTRFNTEEEMKKADAYVRSIAEKSFTGGTTCNISVISSRVPMELTDRNLQLLDKVNVILGNNGMQKLEWRSSGGGSDAGDVTCAGIPVLDDFGAEGAKFHSRDEYALIHSLATGALRVAVIVSELN